MINNHIHDWSSLMDLGILGISPLTLTLRKLRLEHLQSHYVDDDHPDRTEKNNQIAKYYREGALLSILEQLIPFQLEIIVTCQGALAHS